MSKPIEFTVSELRQIDTDGKDFVLEKGNIVISIELQFKTTTIDGYGFVKLWGWQRGMGDILDKLIGRVKPTVTPAELVDIVNQEIAKVYNALTAKE